MSFLRFPSTQLLIVPQVYWPAILSYLKENYHQSDSWLHAGDKPLTIQEVREVIHFSSLTPVSEKKIIVLSNVDSLSKESANALLKLLEEPPDYLSILLLAETNRLLPTLLSRAQLLDTSATFATMNLPLFLDKPDETPKSTQEILYWSSLRHSSISEELFNQAFFPSES